MSGIVGYISGRDVILATNLGLFLGWPLTWFGLVFGILLSGAISILLVLALLFSGKYKEKAWMVFIPYSPASCRVRS